MRRQRILIASAIATMVGLTAAAQAPPGTGPITFPSVTNQSPSKCESATVIATSGGKAFFLHGGFYARNGATYFGTFLSLPGCNGFVTIQFAPQVTACSFLLTSYTTQAISVTYGDGGLNSATYNVTANSSVPVSL